MFTLPILPDTIRVPLAEAGFGDAVAIVRPLDVEAASRWYDAFPGADARSLAATTLVFDQLVGIEGLEMAGDTGAPVPFDPANVAHRRSMPMALRTAVFLAIMDRTKVSERLEKNSDSPSDSGGTSDTGSSAVDDAPPASVTP